MYMGGGLKQFRIVRKGISEVYKKNSVFGVSMVT